MDEYLLNRNFQGGKKKVLQQKHYGKLDFFNYVIIKI